jgi:hypothetical protein
MIRRAPASCCSASVSTLPNVMSGFSAAACSNTGANILHGPHHSAQKSTNVIPSDVTVVSKFSMVKVLVDI